MNEMNDESPEVEDDNTPNLSPEAEFRALKERAKQMSMRVSPNIGLDTLRNKVNGALDGSIVVDDDDDENKEEEGNVDQDPEESAMPVARRKKTRKETRAEIRKRLREEKLRLIRCRIVCMNPAKAELTGEIFCVGNKYLGEVKKLIPYNDAAESGYHVPKVLFDHLNQQEFLQTRSRRVGGQIKVETRWVKEFSMEVLEPLTPEEIRKLAQDQRAGNRLEDTDTA